MRKQKAIIQSIGILVALYAYTVNAQNPLISHIYAADPSAHVWENDPNTLWLYTSHDVPGTNHHASMFDYHVFSTNDLENWVDHGRVLSVDDVSWAISHAWAIDSVYWQDTYYLVYCMIERKTGIFRTGLATSDKPEGPFTDIGFIQGVEWGQDPALFVDEDKQPYLFWGAAGSCFGAKLATDLKAIIPETKVDLTKQLTNVYEGPWVHKYEGTYYLSYPGLKNKQWPETMYYATSKHPLGPYNYQGEYIAEFDKQSGTNHGAIVKFKNDWLAFYHSAWLSDGISESRNLMADYLHYTKAGAIKTITPSKEGLGNATCVIKLEAENGKSAGGKLDGTEVKTTIQGFSGSGYVSGFDLEYNYVDVLAQVAKNQKFKLKIRYAAQQERHINLMINELMYNGSTSNYKEIILPKSDGFTTIDIGEIQLKTGDNHLRVTSKDGDMAIDYFLFEPIKN